MARFPNRSDFSSFPVDSAGFNSFPQSDVFETLVLDEYEAPESDNVVFDLKQ